MNVEPEKYPNSRDSKRTRVLMNASLFTPDGALSIRVKDISATGAHVQTESRMLSDCDAVFEKASLFVAARVTWTRDKEAGLRFYRLLTAQEMAMFGHSVTDPGVDS